jgi:micrococcal nuclease
MKFYLIAILLIANYAHSAGTTGHLHSKSQWVGLVTHITDGDTLWVRPAKASEPVKIRMDGLDAPEICQAYGDTSRRALAGLVSNQVVVVQGRRRDAYGRLLATLSVHGDDVGSAMVAQGHAWSYHSTRNGGPYAAQEAHARAARRGLFAHATAQEPRLFRKKHGSCHV